MTRQNIDFDVSIEIEPAKEVLLKPGSVVNVSWVPKAEECQGIQAGEQEAQLPEAQKQAAQQAGPGQQLAPLQRACYDLDSGSLVGPVPENACRRLAAYGDIQGSIRSVRKDDKGRPCSLLVRVQLADGQPVPLKGEFKAEVCRNMGYAGWQPNSSVTAVLSAHACVCSRMQ